MTFYDVTDAVTDIVPLEMREPATIARTIAIDEIYKNGPAYRPSSIDYVDRFGGRGTATIYVSFRRDDGTRVYSKIFDIKNNKITRVYDSVGCSNTLRYESEESKTEIPEIVEGGGIIWFDSGTEFIDITEGVTNAVPAEMLEMTITARAQVLDEIYKNGPVHTYSAMSYVKKPDDTAERDELYKYGPRFTHFDSGYDEYARKVNEFLICASFDRDDGTKVDASVFVVHNSRVVEIRKSPKCAPITD